MNDKELLELAAKAAGIEIKEWDMGAVPMIHGNTESGTLFRDLWNPLTDDADALRLAVKLDMNVEVWNPFKEVWVVAEGYDVIEEPWGEDKLAATRRAIVRAAAEIGRGME
jgi:hypothetical protein